MEADLATIRGFSCPQCRAPFLEDAVTAFAPVLTCRSCNHYFPRPGRITRRLREPDPGPPPKGIKLLKSETGFEIELNARFGIAPTPFPLAGGIIVLAVIVLAGANHERLDLYDSTFWGVMLGFAFAAFLLVRTRIGADGDRGWIFTGVGRIGFRQTFSWQDIDEITVELSNPGSNRDKYRAIHIAGVRDHLVFAAGLPEQLQMYIAALLRFLVSSGKDRVSPP
ncbi:hypothetical protein ACFSM5_20390 [Lacibacterium aquatile]|uniref:DUF304 domain-containing protein n=1 Tax=Lacibacterium aquatile TaxID=1168082 RepID=A0ABW5DZQ5_9PROT